MGMDVDEEYASMVKKVLYSGAAYFALFLLSIVLDLVSHLTCSKELGTCGLVASTAKTILYQENFDDDNFYSADNLPLYLGSNAIYICIGASIFFCAYYGAKNSSKDCLLVYVCTNACCCICTGIGLAGTSVFFGWLSLIECGDDWSAPNAPTGWSGPEDCESAIFMSKLYGAIGMAFYGASIIVNCASMIFGCNLRGKLEKGVVIVVQPGAPPTTAQPVGGQIQMPVGGNPKFDPETGQPIRA
jgi:hypothetical protein